MEAFVYVHAIFIRFVDDDDGDDEHSGEHFVPVIASPHPRDLARLEGLRRLETALEMTHSCVTLQFSFEIAHRNCRNRLFPRNSKD